MTTGYLHPAYAESLAYLGEPRHLPESHAWIIKRVIPGYSECDAMGCYPLFACQDWSRLHVDLDGLTDEIVSLAVVTDPFGVQDAVTLRNAFKDRVVPFKDHFVVDLKRSVESIGTPRHRTAARKALRSLSVERCASADQHLAEWVGLYGTLVDRHRIRGIATFSKSVFAKQLSVPGICAFRAVYKGETVGMTLWYQQADFVYYHLGASSEIGYQMHASFALFWSAIRAFAANGFRELDLGAGAGLADSAPDGLRQFKNGWSTGTRMAYFCGRIFDREKYSRIVRASGYQNASYFPAYRQGEFI